MQSSSRIDHNIFEIPGEENHDPVGENGAREDQQQIPEDANVDRVGENERLRNSRTYEDLFMENVRNLGSVSNGESQADLETKQRQ